jgi:hypothetical protein
LTADEIRLTAGKPRSWQIEIDVESRQ